MRERERRKTTGVSPVTWWRWEQANQAPRRVALGPNSVGWSRAEVADWVAQRIAEREVKITAPRDRPGKSNCERRDGKGRSMRAANLAALLKGVKPNAGGGYVALCPAHDDHNPSLAVKDGDRCVLVNCRANCDLDSIVSALNITKADLFFMPQTDAVSDRSSPPMTTKMNRARSSSKPPGIIRKIFASVGLMAAVVGAGI